MKAGDLVTSERCAAEIGSIRCASALVISVELSHHEQTQYDSQNYYDREIYGCTLMCKCGVFEEYDDRLEIL